jgi:uncharacterized membrane protein
MEFISSLHPAVVHFPIVLFCTYFIFEVISYFNNKFETSAIIILFLGVLTAILAVITGNQALVEFQRSGEVSDLVNSIIEEHEFYATLLLWYYFVILILRYFLQLKKKLNKRNKIILIFFGIIGLVLLFETGTLGGKLVFNWGVGIDRGLNISE